MTQRTPRKRHREHRDDCARADFLGLNAKVAKSAKGATVGVRSDKKDREDVKEPKVDTVIRAERLSAVREVVVSPGSAGAGVIATAGRGDTVLNCVMGEVEQSAWGVARTNH